MIVRLVGCWPLLTKRTRDLRALHKALDELQHLLLDRAHVAHDRVLRGDGALAGNLGRDELKARGGVAHRQCDKANEISGLTYSFKFQSVLEQK